MNGNRVVVAGGLAQKPGYAGHAWMFLQWLLGLRRLGYEVLFIDRLTPEMGVSSGGVKRLSALMHRFGLAEDFHLAGTENEALAGIPRQEAITRARGALMINFNGFLQDEELLDAAGWRVYLDIDPGFAQMWRELGLHDAFTGHDAFVTIAENIGRPSCQVPTGGLRWIATRQPVVLDEWPKCNEGGAKVTSVGAWRGPFAPVDFEGTTYGLRVHEFRKFAELPLRADADFEMALDIDKEETSDLEMLRRARWRLVNPEVVVGTLDAYRDFIGRSRAELMVAKNMYVETRSGWFSDRSACYLASGRPVIAEDTGLDALYPLGDGLIAFRTLEEAVAAVELVQSDYARQAAAAREIAETYFDSDKVLGSLLDRLSGPVP